MPFHRVLPFYQEWSRKYGMISGVVISDPDMIKEVLVNNYNIAGSTEKLALSPLGKILFGEGPVVLEGEKWALHRESQTKLLIWSELK
jgi:hypothetical protein